MVFLFKHNNKKYYLKHVKWKKKSLPSDFLLKFKGELTNFDKKIIGIICTNDKISENALSELNRSYGLAICNPNQLGDKKYFLRLFFNTNKKRKEVINLIRKNNFETFE